MDPSNRLPVDLLRTNREPNVFELAAARDLLHRIESDLFGLHAEISIVNTRLNDLELYRRGFFTFDPPGPLPNAFQPSPAQMSSNSAEIEVYTQRIAETEAYLVHLVSQIDPTEQLQAMVRRVISPIRRVPHHILRHIFEYCESWFPASLSAMDAPILLTHVCSSFRTIALAMPKLWTSVSFKLGRMEMPGSLLGRGEEDKYRMLYSLGSGMEQYLLRLGSLPLDLDINYKDFPRGADNQTRQLYFEMNKVVLSHHARWRDVRISYHDTLPEEIMGHLRSFTPENLPMIRTLDLEDMDQDDNISSVEFIPVLACPTLRTLCGFRFDGLHFHREVLRTSFANLTTLTSTTLECSIPDIVITLQMCPSLVNLRLPKLCKTDHSNIDNNFLITLPSLEYLHVSESSSIIDGESVVIEYFSAPKLKRVDYEGDCMYPSVVSFFKRSISLTVLRMNFKISGVLFIEALRCCPQLREIEQLPRLLGEDIEEYLAYDALFTRLVDADDAGNLVCPSLQVLSHEHQPISVVQFDVLQALIMRKITPSPGLAAWDFLYIADLHVTTQMKAVVEELLGHYRRSQICIDIDCYDDDDEMSE